MDSNDADDGDQPAEKKDEDDYEFSSKWHMKIADLVHR